MDKKTRKNIIRGTALVLVVALLAALPAIAGSDSSDKVKQSILTAPAVRGSIENKLMFSGSLFAEEEEKAAIPADVRVDEILVSNGDVVKEGDPLAALDRVSLMTAITTVINEMHTVEAQAAQLKFNLLREGEITVNEKHEILVGGWPIDKKEYTNYAQFLMLTETHREYEENLAKLFKMYSAGALLAPCDGVVNNIDKSVVKLSDDGEHSGGIVFMLDTGADMSGLVLLSDAAPTPTPAPTPAPTPMPSPTPLPIPGAYFVAKVQEVKDGAVDVIVDPTPQTDPEAPEINEDNMTVFQTIAGKYNKGDILLISLGGIKVYQPAPTPKPPVPDLSALLGMFGGGGYGGSAAKTAEPYDVDAVTVMSVVPQQTMTLNLTVDEHDITALNVGQSLEISIDALPKESFIGTVDRISNSGTNEGGSSKFTVEVSMDKTADMLPGMNASASIVLSTVDDCLLIPVAALHEDSQGYFVYTAYNERKELFSGERRVELGFSDGDNAEIISGLSENETVWYGYYDTVEISNKAS